jgi:hypothetical protein
VKGQEKARACHKEVAAPVHNSIVDGFRTAWFIDTVHGDVKLDEHDRDDVSDGYKQYPDGEESATVEHGMDDRVDCSGCLFLRLMLDVDASDKPDRRQYLIGFVETFDFKSPRISPFWMCVSKGNFDDASSFIKNCEFNECR